jgi:23S rRNA (pseudouridine1915-N3)-methyltransferase
LRWIVVAVGKLKEAHYRDGTAEYLARLARSRPFKLVEIADSVVKPGREAAALREEAERIRKACNGARIVALTERGEQVSTAQLAAKLEAQEALGGDLAFVIGGANGLDVEVERGAAWQLALSALTLPHQLARVVLLEQLYRVETMRRGEPYHRAGTVG